jgi:hypothetical protein
MRRARFAELVRDSRLEAGAALAAAVLAAAAVLGATAPRGPQVSPDSVFYLAAADSFRGGEGLLSFDGSPLTLFPPGFPVGVATFGEVAGGDLLGARVLNSLCLALIVIAGWVLLRRHVRSTVLRLVGLAGVAAAPTLFSVSSAVWSEPLFIALMLLVALVLEAELERSRGRRWLVLAGLLAGCAFSVRYSGIWVAGAGAFVLLAANRRELTRRARTHRAGLFLLAACIVPALVVLRNLRADGRPFGPRVDPSRSLGENTADAIDGIWRWFVPDVAAHALRAEFLAALVMAFGVWLVTRKRTTGSGERADSASRATESADRAPLWPLVLLALGYVAFLVVSASTTSLDPIGPRLLSPAFVPLVVAALAGVDRVLTSSLARGPLIALGAGLVVLWVGAQLQLTRVQFDNLRHNGSGYTERGWQDSALVSLVRRREVAPRFSNYPQALYFLTSTPRSGCWPTPALGVCTFEGPDLKQLSAAETAYLAWFDEAGLTDPYLPPALVRRLRLVEVARVADGGLYRVAAAPGP